MSRFRKLLCLAGLFGLTTVQLPVSSGSQSVGSDLGIVEEHPIEFTSPAIKEGLQAQIVKRRITIQPGILWVNDRQIVLKKELIVDVPNCPLLAVKNEPLPLTAAGNKGISSKHLLKASRACETDQAPIQGVIAPGSIRVKPSTADANYFKQKVDYAFDLSWGSLSRMAEGSTIKDGQTVYCDYTYFTRRIDTLIVDENGKMKLVTGKPNRTAPEPPAIDHHCLPLANIYAEPGAEPLKVSDFMPISAVGPAIESTQRREANRRALHRSLAKLKAGHPIKICFWGDSITAGADASSYDYSFANTVVMKLKEKFPNAHIEAVNAGIGGSNTKGRLKDFETQVAAHKPDLIIVEFVNDVHQPREVLEVNYRLVANKADKAGAELLLVNPHLPAPVLLGVVDWGLVSKAPFYSVLRKFAAEHDVAFADVTKRWERLQKEGLTPELLLVDRLVHPNNKGHGLYAEEILKCFD